MKKLNILLLITFTLIILVGCGKKVADEEQIQMDLEAFTQKAILKDGEKIMEITIDKRQTQKDAKTDTVWCTVQTEDERCEYEKNFVLAYSLYDEGGWMLDEVSVSDRSSWVITPLTGISDDEISASLTGIEVMVNGENWPVTQANIKSISVDSHETNLEAQKDIVTATLVIDDLVEEASGQLTINYTFNHGSWVMDSISGKENFSARNKPGLELNVTEDILLAAINGQSFEYNPQEPRIYRTQEIIIDKDMVSDFVIEKQEASSKGTLLQYFCSCTLTKPYTTFTLAIEIPYSYSDKWSMQDISVTAECVSVDIVGTWTGVTMWDDNCGLDITEMDAEGNISGTYSNYDKSLSYYVAGKINRDNLEMNLKGGDIIENPNNRFKAYDITAQIDVENSSIIGDADSDFTVTQ